MEGEGCFCGVWESKDGRRGAGCCCLVSLGEMSLGDVTNITQQTYLWEMIGGGDDRGPGGPAG